MLSFRAWRVPALLLAALGSAVLAAAVLAPPPAAAQVTLLRDAQGHPYQVQLGVDSASGLSCVPGPSAPTCLVYGGTGGGGGLTSLATTASAACPPVTAGVNKPLIINLFSALCVVWTDPATGNQISFSDTTQVDQALSPTLSATYPFPHVDGAGVLAARVSGIAGGAVFTAQISRNPLAASPVWTTTPIFVNNAFVAGGTIAADGDIVIPIPAAGVVRLLTSTGGSGSPKVTYYISAATGPQVMPQPVLAGGYTAPQTPLTQNPGYIGCRTATATPTLSTDGQGQHVMCGSEGKVVVLPYALKEQQVRGTASATTTTATAMIAAGGAGVKTYITGVQCGNSSATATNVTFSDAAASVMYVPATGGNNMVFPTPLVTAANTAFTFAATTAVTTMTCNAQGFVGP